MGKFAGTVFGTLAAVVLAYYLLSGYYSPLANWLSPYFGGDISLIFGLIFALFGNPLNYPVLIEVWMAVGAVIGFSVRRVGGSVASTFMVHFLCWFIMIVGLLGYAFAFIPSTNGLLTGYSTSGINLTPAIPLMPIPPYGTNILTILTEPVVFQLFQSLINLLSGGIPVSAGSSTSSLAGLAGSFIEPLIIHSILLFVLSAFTAAFTAYLAHNMILTLDRRDVIRQFRMTGRAVVLLAIAVVLILVLSGAADGIISSAGAGGGLNFVGNRGHQPVGAAVLANASIGAVKGMTGFISHYTAASSAAQKFNQLNGTAAGASSQSGYDETSLNLISPDGNLYSTCVFASNSTFPQASVPGNGQVDLSLMVMSKNLINLPTLSLFSGALSPTGGSSSSLSPSTFLSLLPPELLILYVTPGSAPIAQAASSQASYYSNVAGYPFTLIAELTNGTFFGNQILPALHLVQGGGIFVYGSNYPVESAAAQFASSYLPALHKDGMIAGFASDLESGAPFVPTAYGSDSALIVSGSVGNSSLLAPAGASGAVPFPLFPQGRISFCIGLIYKTFFAYGSGLHRMQLSQITGSKPFTFSSFASSSFLGILTPIGRTGFGLNSIPSSYNGTIFTDSIPFPPGNQTVNSSGWMYVNESNQNQFGPNTTVSFDSPLPPFVVISTTDTVVGTNISVQAVARNLGNASVTGLSVSFPGIEQYGSGGLPAPNGMGYRNSSRLAPGQAFSVTFTVNASNPGIYVLPGIRYSYALGNSTYSMQTSATQVNAGNMSFIALFPGYLAKTTFDLTSRFYPGATYNEILMMSYAIPLLFFGAAIRAEHSAYKKWKEKRLLLLEHEAMRTEEEGVQ